MSRIDTIGAPLSIGLVTDWCPPRVGGVERQVAGLALALARRGHAVHLFTTTANPSPIAGVTIHPIYTAMVGEVAAPNLFKVAELRSMLMAAGVQLVHAHGMFSTLAIGGLLAAHRARLPSIMTHHSLLRHSPTLPAAWLTYRLFSHRATLVTAVSLAAAADARRASARADVPLLPNGLDRTPWRASTPSNRSVPRVVSVMRLARKKSPRDLIEAVPLVLRRISGEVIFTIVGDGPERVALERQARRLGVAAQIEFLGACTPARVAAVLAESDLFALPSRREAFGLALLEARAAGLPIVARASGGVPEVVRHGAQGLLAHNAAEFVDALVTLIGDAALRARCAAAARHGLEAYDWDAVVDRHETVYRQAIVSCR
jgi:glycosyltransferase involved in cell wall biosynthesis